MSSSLTVTDEMSPFTRYWYKGNEKIGRPKPPCKIDIAVHCPMYLKVFD